MRVGVLLAVALSILAGPGPLGEEVAKQGQSSEIKLERVVSGPLAEVNGKYKLRVRQVTYAPAGFIGEPHHAGPGIRSLTAGELTDAQPEKTTVYRARDCFFESGEVTHTVRNDGRTPVVLINFERLPADRSGSSAVPVRGK